jgi:tRNA-dihydrouridine synthase 1
MFHARLFATDPHYRASMFAPLRNSIPSPPDPYHTSQLTPADHHLDGNPRFDRPLVVQFCANDPQHLLAAASLVAPFADAIDLNLGCPQGIARRGRYGAFLQEDPALVFRLINTLHRELAIPVTAKCRILDTRGATLKYVSMLFEAGASWVCVHGRRRECKGHNTGLADWEIIRWVRERLPAECVLFANGNVLQHGDLGRCLEATGVDGVMTAEGNLHDPGIFMGQPGGDLRESGCAEGEYWVGRDGVGGYRMDAVLRRYFDIIYRYILDRPPPERRPLFMPGDPQPEQRTRNGEDKVEAEDDQPPKKKQKMSKAEKKQMRVAEPNLSAIQGHLFSLLRPLVAKHTNIRDALARCRAGDISAFENILSMVEHAVQQGLVEYERNPEEWAEMERERTEVMAKGEIFDDPESSKDAIARCKRPWWVCQPYVRPLPKEAIANGSMKVSKKKLKSEKGDEEKMVDKAQLRVEGKGKNMENVEGEVPKEAVVCG